MIIIINNIIKIDIPLSQFRAKHTQDKISFKNTMKPFKDRVRILPASPGRSPEVPTWQETHSPLQPLLKSCSKLESDHWQQDWIVSSFQNCFPAEMWL